MSLIDNEQNPEEIMEKAEAQRDAMRESGGANVGEGTEKPVFPQSLNGGVSNIDHQPPQESDGIIEVTKNSNGEIVAVKISEDIEQADLTKWLNDEIEKALQERTEEIIEDVKEMGMEAKYKNHNPEVGCRCENCRIAMSFEVAVAHLKSKYKIND